MTSSISPYEHICRELVDQDIQSVINPINNRIREVTAAKLDIYDFSWEDFIICDSTGREFTGILTEDYADLKFGSLNFRPNSDPYSHVVNYEKNMLLSVYKLYCKEFESPHDYDDMNRITTSFFNMKTQDRLVIIEGSGFIMEGKSSFYHNKKYVEAAIQSLESSERIRSPEGIFDTLVIPEGDELWRVFQRGTKTPLLATEYQVYIKYLWFYSVMEAIVNSEIGKKDSNSINTACIVLDRASLDHDLFDHVLGCNSDALLEFTKFFRKIMEAKFTEVEYIMMLFHKYPPWPLAQKVKREFEYEFYKSKTQLHSLTSSYYQARHSLLNCFNESQFDNFLYNDIQKAIFLCAPTVMTQLKRASECAK